VQWGIDVGQPRVGSFTWAERMGSKRIRQRFDCPDTEGGWALSLSAIVYGVVRIRRDRVGGFVSSRRSRELACAEWEDGWGGWMMVELALMERVGKGLHYNMGV
jgi:hypothetical protein